MNHFKAIRRQNIIIIIIIMKCNINRLLFPMGLWPILPTTKRLGFKNISFYQRAIRIIRWAHRNQANQAVGGIYLFIYF